MAIHTAAPWRRLSSHRSHPTVVNGCLLHQRAALHLLTRSKALLRCRPAGYAAMQGHRPSFFDSVFLSECHKLCHRGTPYCSTLQLLSTSLRNMCREPRSLVDAVVLPSPTSCRCRVVVFGGAEAGAVDVQSSRDCVGLGHTGRRPPPVTATDNESACLSSPMVGSRVGTPPICGPCIQCEPARSTRFISRCFFASLHSAAVRARARAHTPWQTLPDKLDRLLFPTTAFLSATLESVDGRVSGATTFRRCVFHVRSSGAFLGDIIGAKRAALPDLILARVDDAVNTLEFAI